MSTTTLPLSQEDVLAKIYRDLARLAGEIAIDRCRNRVLMALVKDNLKISDEQLNELFRKELEQNLEQLCQDITTPMLSELQEPTDMAGGCCGGKG